MDHLIPTTRQDLVLINKKKNLSCCGFCYSSRPVKIKESKKIDKYLDLATELKKKKMEHEGDSTICSWWLGKKTGGIVNQRKNQDHLDHIIVKICWNTQKSLGNLKKLAVRQAVKVHLLILV